MECGREHHKLKSYDARRSGAFAGENQMVGEKVHQLAKNSPRRLNESPRSKVFSPIFNCCLIGQPNFTAVSLKNDKPLRNPSVMITNRAPLRDKCCPRPGQHAILPHQTRNCGLSHSGFERRNLQPIEHGIEAGGRSASVPTASMQASARRPSVNSMMRS